MGLLENCKLPGLLSEQPAVPCLQLHRGEAPGEIRSPENANIVDGPNAPRVETLIISFRE